MGNLFEQHPFDVIRSFHEIRLVTTRGTQIVDHTDPARVEPRLRAPYFVFEVYAATEVRNGDGITSTLYSSKPLWASYFFYVWSNGHVDPCDPDVLTALLDREGKTTCVQTKGPPVGAWIKRIYEWNHPTLLIRRGTQPGQIVWTEIPACDLPAKGREIHPHGLWDIQILPLDEDLKIRFPKGSAGGEDQAPRYVVEKDLPLQSQMIVWANGMPLWMCRGNQKWFEVIFVPHYQTPRFEIIVWEQISLPSEVPEEQRA